MSRWFTFTIIVALVGAALAGPAVVVDVARAQSQSQEMGAANAASAASLGAQASLAPQLEPMRPFIGKTWRSVPPADAAKRVVDVSKWERALNGTAVRILHSINDGIYGGETIVFWDAEKQSLVYYYFTTGGHYTQGTLEYKGGAWIGNAIVTGDSDGVTEVRSTTMILPDGRMDSKAEYLQKGAWTPGHEFFYIEDPTAQGAHKTFHRPPDSSPLPI